MGKLAVLAVTLGVMGALAAGVAVRSAGGETHGPAVLVARGEFHAVSWGTRGMATLRRDASGTLTMHFDEAFVTEDAPRLYVYVAGFSKGQQGDWKFAGMLRKASGAQSYTVPAGVVTGRRAAVMIFCGKCAKIWGEAELAPARAPSV